MKLWIKKLLEQVEFGDKPKSHRVNLSEECGTILFLLDTYSKHLFDLEGHPLRRARDEFEQFARELVSADKTELEKSLFRFRQYFANYRTAEFASVQKSFEDLKTIIWNFIEQLSNDFSDEQMGDRELNAKLEALKAAVENDSLDVLRSRSREFIQLYMTHHAKKDHRRLKRMRTIRQSLSQMKTQTNVPDRNIKVDAETNLFNRRSFDEHLKHQAALSQMESAPVSLLLVEIDDIQRLVGGYGEDFGKFILKECSRVLQECFNREHDYIARTGSESFAVVMGMHALSLAKKRAEAALNRIRGEIFAKDSIELRFTVSMGLSQHNDGEAPETWYDRTIVALLASKDGGRDRLTASSSNDQAA